MNDGQIINDLEKISDFGIKLINSAKKPLIISGYGVRSANAVKELLQLIKKI